MDTNTLIAIFTTFMASTGFWAWLSSVTNKRSASSKMLVGLAHDRIIDLSGHYIRRGNYITMDEYDNLVNYLYTPYKALLGNGSADRAIEEIKKLRLVP